MDAGVGRRSDGFRFALPILRPAKIFSMRRWFGLAVQYGV